jgi:hypothetical protein
MKTHGLLLITLLCSPLAQAVIDASPYSLSDNWEKNYRGSSIMVSYYRTKVYSWAEALDAVTYPPNDYLTPVLEVTPATYGDLDSDNDSVPDILTPEMATLTWPTRPFTLYTLESATARSPNVWTEVGQSHLESSTPGHAECHISLATPVGQVSEKLSWRVKITSFDSDEDGLTDAEEYQFGTNPYSAYTDSDLLTDFQEVARYHTDPNYSDSDEDGTADDADPDIYAVAGIPLAPSLPESTYAPDVKWLYAERSVIYGFTEHTSYPPPTTPAQGYFASWSNFKAPYIQDVNTNGVIGTAKTYKDLLSNLRIDFPFPADEDGIAQSSINGEQASIWYNYKYPIKVEFLRHSEAQIKLMTSDSVRIGITKNLMIIKWEDAYDDPKYPPDGTPPPRAIELMDYSMPVNGRVSGPRHFGTSNIHGGATKSIKQSFHTPEFKKVSHDEKGWDATGDELWCGLAINESTSVRLEGFSEKRKAVLDLLEIVAIEGADNVSLTSHSLPIIGDTFQVKGISATKDAGARIVLRLKAAPQTIFASLRVNVFARREIPVTIYRIYDSRQDGTPFSDGFTNEEIISNLNAVYLKQGNIQFYEDSSSSSYDTKYDRSTQKLTLNATPFFENSTLIKNASSRLRKLTEKGIYGRPKPAKLIIHLVNRIEPSSASDKGIFGYTTCKSDEIVGRSCFIQANADTSIFAHELGHAMELGERRVGQGKCHDHGLWPSSFNLRDSKSENQYGLMYDLFKLSKTIPWIRRADCIKANEESKTLE